MARGRGNQHQGQQNSNQNFQGQNQPNGNQYQGNNSNQWQGDNGNQYQGNNGNQGQGNNGNQWQGNNQQGHYVSPNYKGKRPRNDTGSQNGHVNNGSQTNGDQQGNVEPRNTNGAQKNNNKRRNSYDLHQDHLRDAWKKQQQDSKRQQQIEAETLFLQSQKHSVESQSEPSPSVINAVKFLRMLSKKQISDNHKEKARSAVDRLQSYVNQQIQPDKESQENLSILVGWVLWFGHSSTSLSNPDVANKISKAIEYWEVRFGIAPPQPEEEEHSKPTKKEVEAEKSQSETNADIVQLLTDLDQFLKYNGVTFRRIDGDKVYYSNACAATEEEKKKEYRFVEISEKQDSVKFEGNEMIIADSAMFRAAEYAFIVWFVEQEAADKLARVKKENERVRQEMALANPEARKELETFEKGLEAQKAQVLHKQMEAQLAFEKKQKAELLKLEESLERQRREFFGLPSLDVGKPKSRFPLSAFTASAHRSASPVLKPDYCNYIFDSLKTPAKAVDPTIPVAVKKPTVGEKKKPTVNGKKKKLAYPQFQHTSAGVFMVDLYKGDSSNGKAGDSHITQDVNGTYICITPVSVPCTTGCRECLKLIGGSDDLDMDLL